jgi:mannose-6-phosphate isomerase-like protein (cupin superfamily)
MAIRRVVTGHTPGGKSVFASDGPPPLVRTAPGRDDLGIIAVWATDHGMTAVPGSDDPTPSMVTYVPGPGGTRLLVTVLPPDSGGPGAVPSQLAGASPAAAGFPGLNEAMEADNPGMHTTDTVDYDIIMSGELWLELDDGQTVHLKPGDIVIQTGTRHAWRNRGTEPCVMYSVLVGAPREA